MGAVVGAVVGLNVGVVEATVGAVRVVGAVVEVNVGVVGIVGERLAMDRMPWLRCSWTSSVPALEQR